MDTLIRRFLFAFLITTTGAVSATAEQPTSYLFAVQQELSRLNIKASCSERTESCTFVHLDVSSSAREQTIQISVNATTATVAITIDRFVPLVDPQGPSIELARRLLSLNREMISCRLDWDQQNNAVRLSAVLNIDSNFDRKAFRSVMRGFLATAERIGPELRRLALTTPPANE